MQTTQYGARDDSLAPRWLNPPQWLAWDSLLNLLMGPGVVEVFLILSHCAMQMPLAQNQEMVQAFPPYATQTSFTDRVCIRFFIGCPQDPNSCS
jgi:hypothetical protein